MIEADSLAQNVWSIGTFVCKSGILTLINVVVTGVPKSSIIAMWMACSYELGHTQTNYDITLFY
jgi:hypothetical protein